MTDDHSIADREGNRRSLAYRIRRAAALTVCGGTLVIGGAHADDLPPGTDRDLVLATCSSCHSIKLVAQQRLSREDWEETLEWMASEQGMPRLGTRDRRLILRYLSTHLNPAMPR